jgi:hypothetical protein
MWIKPLLGMTVSFPGKEVGLDLCKTTYGLQFFGRHWFLKLHTFLLNIGFQPSTADPCIYIRNTNGKLLIFSVYVDDLALFSSHPEAVLLRIYEYCPLKTNHTHSYSPLCSVCS